MTLFLLSLLFGFLFSIYAGFISARIMTFQEHRNRAGVLTSQIRHAFTKKEVLVHALAQAEEIRMSGLLLLEAGHRSAGQAIVVVGEEFVQTLRGKICWRDSILEDNPNWLLYTPIYSDEKIDAFEKSIRDAKMSLVVVLSPNICR